MTQIYVFLIMDLYNHLNTYYLMVWYPSACSKMFPALIILQKDYLQVCRVVFLCFRFNTIQTSIKTLIQFLSLQLCVSWNEHFKKVEKYDETSYTCQIIISSIPRQWNYHNGLLSHRSGTHLKIKSFTFPNAPFWQICFVTFHEGLFISIFYIMMK